MMWGHPFCRLVDARSVVVSPDEPDTLGNDHTAHKLPGGSGTTGATGCDPSHPRFVSPSRPDWCPHVGPSVQVPPTMSAQIRPDCGIEFWCRGCTPVALRSRQPVIGRFG